MRSKDYFICSHCNKNISNNAIGTAHRNHCNFCLWSKHVDINRGDRKSKCKGSMEPIGLTFKNDTGELMLVHLCKICGKISINRIAGDDNKEEVMKIFSVSKGVSEVMRKWLEEDGVKLARGGDRKGIETQVFGKQI